MTDHGVTVRPVARRRLDADVLPLWLCVAGICSGLLMVLAAVLEGGGSHGEAGPAHVHTDHAHHALMIVGTTLIMMSPFAFPLLRTVVRTTMWDEAAVAVAAAWTAFMGLWCVAAIGMHVVGELLVLAITAPGALAVLTGLCVVAQLSRRRAALLNACGRTRPMRPGRPSEGGLVWAADSAYRCMKVCAPAMTLMALSPALAASMVLTALLWWERFSGRRSELRVPLLLGYLAVGAGMLIAVSA
jgi:hypothetical protein